MRSRTIQRAGTPSDPVTEVDLVAYVAATQVMAPSRLVDKVMAAIAASPMPRRSPVLPWASVRASWSSLPRFHAAAALIVLAMTCTAGIALAVATATQVGRDEAPALVSPTDSPEPSLPAAVATTMAEPSERPDPTAAAPVPDRPAARPSHTKQPAAPTSRPPRADGDERDDGDAESSDGGGHDGDASEIERDHSESTDSPEWTPHPTEEPSDPE
jgi:hypothetical protein